MKTPPLFHVNSLLLAASILTDTDREQFERIKTRSASLDAQCARFNASGLASATEAARAAYTAEPTDENLNHFHSAEDRESRHARGADSMLAVVEASQAKFQREVLAPWAMALLDRMCEFLAVRIDAFIVEERARALAVLGTESAASGYVDYVSGYLPRLERLREKFAEGVAGRGAQPVSLGTLLHELRSVCRISLLDGETVLDESDATNTVDATGPTFIDGASLAEEAAARAATGIKVVLPPIIDGKSDGAVLDAVGSAEHDLALAHEDSLALAEAEMASAKEGTLENHASAQA